MSLSTPRPVVDDKGYRPEIRGISTVFGGSDKVSDDETDDNDRNLPTIEELLFNYLLVQGFTTGDGGFDKTRGVKEVAADKRTVSVNQARSREGNDSGESPGDPSVLLGDGSFSFSEAEANNNTLRAESIMIPGPGLFDSPETANKSITPAPLCSSYGWHDVDDFPKRAPCSPLAKQGALTSDPLYPCTSSTRFLSEPFHDSVGTELSRHAGSEVTTSSSSPLPGHCRVSPEAQLSQEGRLHTIRGVVNDHGLVNPNLDTLSLDKGAREY